MAIEVAEKWGHKHQIAPEMVEQWGDFLGGWDWDWWLTMTFRTEVGSGGANRRWKDWEKTINRDLECNSCVKHMQYERCKRGGGVAYELCRYRDRGSVDLEYARFTEFTWRGDWSVPHYHALVKLPDELTDYRRSDAWGKAFEIAGRSRIEPYNHALGASYYCTKYIAKGGEVLFSSGLELVKETV